MRNAGKYIILLAVVVLLKFLSDWFIKIQIPSSESQESLISLMNNIDTVFKIFVVIILFIIGITLATEPE